MQLSGSQGGKIPLHQRAAGLWDALLCKEQHRQFLQRVRVNSGHGAIYGILMTVILCPFYVGAVMMPEHSLLCVFPKW